MRRFRATALVGMCVAVSLANVHPAWAAATGTVVLQGTVGTECRMTGTPALATAANLGSLDQAGSLQIEFGYSCNAAFGYTLSSQNGGLKPAIGDGLIVYDVDVSLPTDGATITDACTSTAIQEGSVTCAFSNSGTDIATNQTGTLDVKWPASESLNVGSYVDSLTISIEVLP